MAFRDLTTKIIHKFAVSPKDTPLFGWPSLELKSPSAEEICSHLFEKWEQRNCICEHSKDS